MNERICFVSPHAYGYFDPSRGYTGGGAERQFYLLSTALADRFDVHVVVGDYGQPKRETREGVTLHRAYPLRARRSPLQPVTHLAVLADAMWRADASVYLHRGRPRNAAVVYLLTRLLGRDWLYHVASDSYLDRQPATMSTPLQWLFERALSGAETIIAQTTAQATQLTERFGVDSTVVPNGYPPAGEPVPHTDREYVLWVGRLDESQKRPDRFLDLAASLPTQQFRLVGPGGSSTRYNQRIKRRATRLDNVEFCGAVSPTEIHEQYRDAKLLVNTSAFEGFPNTFLEAWRQATPVVGLDIDPSRYGGSRDCFADGEMDHLTAIVEWLCTDGDSRATRGRADRARFEREFQLTAVADQYATVLR